MSLGSGGSVGNFAAHANADQPATTTTSLPPKTAGTYAIDGPRITLDTYRVLWRLCNVLHATTYTSLQLHAQTGRPFGRFIGPVPHLDPSTVDTASPVGSEKPNLLLQTLLLLGK